MIPERAQAVVIGGITAIGGGILRDVLLRQVPTVLHQDLYAIPAALGGTVVAVAHAAGSDSHVWMLVGAVLCFGLRLLGLRYGIHMPLARNDASDTSDSEATD